MHALLGIALGIGLVAAIAGCELSLSNTADTTTSTTASDTTTSIGAPIMGTDAADTTGVPADTTTAGSGPPLALVYRGPGGCPSCSEAAADLLRSTKWDLDVR